jgi:protein tyrosine/serine phosphatase
MATARTSKSRTVRTSRSQASEIAPGVYVGGWKDAEGFRGKRYCVLDEVPVDEELPAEQHLPIYDESKDRPLRANLDRLSDLAASARARNEPVLFFCGHGIRRAALAGAWYLHRQDGISLDAAYDRVRAARPKIEHVKDWVGNPGELFDGRSVAPRRD